MNYKYRVSVIVPIYNAQEYLCGCLDSLLAQTIAQNEMQVLLVNDGSTDLSEEICTRYCNEHENFKYKKIKNSGVSAARNCGLKMAEGKYIMYLDSDDKLTAVSVKNVTDFFDTVYEQVDAVTYFMQPYKDGELLKPPARYRKILTGQGVFDLEESPYISQTTMNICVKNRFSDNILFNEKMECHEDQEYINRILMDKLRIGYCPSACYMYNRGNENSCVSTKTHSYYLFELTMTFFENLFSMYDDKVPKYYQATFFHDLRWKLEDRKLYPFHYEKKQFKAAMRRIKKLLARVDTDIIVNNPSIQKNHIFYWLNIKPNVYPTVYIDHEAIDVLADGRTIEHSKRVSMRLIRTSLLDDGRFRIRCECEMGVFNYMKNPPLMYAVENGEKKHKLKLYRSSYSYVGTDIMTNKIYGFEYSFDPEKVKILSFKAVIDSYSFDVKINFMGPAVFRHKLRFYSFAKGKYIITFFNDTLTFERKTDDEIRELELLNARTYNTEVYAYELKCTAIERRKNSRIWLYSDAGTGFKGNAYYQFQNDLKYDDSVERYYVYTRPFGEIEKLFTEEQKSRLIEFGSYEHRVLYLSAEILFFSAYEREKFSPFLLESEEMKYIDIEHFRIIYLPQGIMSFFCADRFSAERAVCDKVVVSTHFEVDNLTGKYRFKDDELIKTGMPKLDFLCKAAASGERVLFAPSWRSYFSPNDNTEKTSISFLKSSSYYREIKAFLNSDRLQKSLESCGTVLDVKFDTAKGSLLRDVLDSGCKNINIIDEDVKAEDYKFLITDFSDLSFDFAYLSRPVLYFVPDYEEFKSGMGVYRELDLPFEKAFGPLAVDAETAVDEFVKFAENGFKIQEEYAERENEFYLPIENCAESIYSYVTNHMIENTD